MLIFSDCLFAESDLPTAILKALLTLLIKFETMDPLFDLEAS